MVFDSKRANPGPPIDPVEPAADGQDGVADRLGLQPTRGHPPEQAVVGVDGRRFGSNRLDCRYAAESTISRCSGLSRQPPSTNSAASQSSSSGCDGRPPLKPKSLGVRDDPLAEVVLPEPVDDHARRQRVPAGRRASRPGPAGGPPRGPSRGRSNSPARAGPRAGRPGRPSRPGWLDVAPVQEVGRARRLRVLGTGRPPSSFGRRGRRAATPAEDRPGAGSSRLRDRVELVVVAAGAVDRQAEERLADGADHVLELVLADCWPHASSPMSRTTLSHGPATRKPVAAIASAVVGAEHVAGELLARRTGRRACRALKRSITQSR